MALVWLLSRTALIAGGCVPGHVGVSADITLRRQAEQTIRDSREFAQSTIDALSSHVCVLDETGTIIAVNQAWKRFAMANSSSVSGSIGDGLNYLALCDRVTGPDAREAARFAAGIRAVLDDEKQLEMEYACHSPGEQRWFLGRITRFPNSHVPRILIEHINITALKLAEAKLRAAGQAAEADARHQVSPDGILVVDNKNHIVSHNKRFLDVWQMPLYDIPDNFPDYAVGG